MQQASFGTAIHRTRAGLLCAGFAMIRLLSRDENGKFALQEFDNDDLPSYAILSHTRIVDNSQEVIFDDIQVGTGEDKAGYRKLLFTEEKAKAAGLQYFWIDTCCNV